MARFTVGQSRTPVMTSNPDSTVPSAHSLLAAGADALQRQQPHQAVAPLQLAAALVPHDPEVALYLARALAMAHRGQEALHQVERALQLAPKDAQVQDRAGDVLTQCHLHEPALAAFRRAVALAPGDPGYRYNLATSLTYHGRVADAEREHEACIARAPNHWQAHLSLSQLRRQTAQSNHIERLRTLLARPGNSVTATVYLNMALAKELEDLGDYPQAFQHLVQGKSAPKALMGYTSDQDAALFDALARSVDNAPAGDGYASREPVFIVGMPRSGTTLVDRVLSSHPQVQSAGELHQFGAAWKQAMGGAGFRMFHPGDISAGRIDNWHALGEAYIQTTRPLTGGQPRFTDKLPHNFLYLGHIARALPNATLVCVRRNPMDTCLGNFRLLFAPESPYFGYSYDPLDVGRYYLLFDRLMAHWNQQFPGRIIQVDYEGLVADQEGATRRLLGAAGLDWDPACLDFTANPAPVATASAGQVREALHAGAIGRWKRYRTQLAPLRALLEDGGIGIDD